MRSTSGSSSPSTRGVWSHHALAGAARAYAYPDSQPGTRPCAPMRFTAQTCGRRSGTVTGRTSGVASIRGWEH